MKLVPVITYVTAAMKKSEGGGGCRGNDQVPEQRRGHKPTALLPVYGLKTF